MNGFVESVSSSLKVFIVSTCFIIFEQWRSRRKATERREDLSGRLEALEEEKETLTAKVAALQEQMSHNKTAKAESSQQAGPSGQEPPKPAVPPVSGTSSPET